MKTMVLLLLVILINHGCQEPDKGTGKQAGARQLAEEAYHQIEANVFSSEKLRLATKKLEVAHKIDPEEPFIYLSNSLLILVQGYTSGNWYKADRFVSGTLERALKLAKHALAINPDLAQTHTHLARIYIVLKEFDNARTHLETAKQLDSDSFYYWYFEGVFAEMQQDRQRAYQFFDESEKRIKHKHQTRLIANHRLNLAEIAGDIKTEETLLLDIIKAKPSSPHVYGNYGVFLNNNDRFEEAIVQYKKAIELGTYPLAVKGLGKAYNNVGLNYQNGRGIEQNYQKAMEFYRKGADLGYHYAIGNVGYMYNKGFGVEQDYSEAKRWYLKAARLGNIFSQLQLGYLYKDGLGGEKEIEQAKRWYRMAADHGDPKGQYRLGAIYDVERQYDEALKWYRMAADQGFERAIDRIKLLKRYGINQ